MKVAPLRRLKRILLTGLFIVAPISLSFMLLAWLVALIDGLLSPLIGVVGRPMPGLGLVIAFLIVLGAGVLGSNMIGQHLLELAEEMLLRIPVFNWVYRTIKQLSEVFSPSGKSSFKSVVLIEYPRPGVYSMGFVTNQVSVQAAGEPRALVCVYVPTNHMYIGDSVLVPADKIIALKMTQQEGIQAAISAGASLPAVLKVVDRKP
jgi:uncharacterized membrane protein